MLAVQLKCWESSQIREFITPFFILKSNGYRRDLILKLLRRLATQCWQRYVDTH